MSTYESILEINPWGRLTTASTTTINLFIKIKSGAQYQVAWGDGTITTHNHNTLASKTYSVAYAGDIYFRAVSGGLKNIDGIRSTAGAWNFDLSLIKLQFPTMTMELYFVGKNNTISGKLSDVPSGLTKSLYLYGLNNTINGMLSDVPSGLIYDVYLSAFTTGVIAGNLSSIPSGLSGSLWLSGNGVSITGDMKTSAPNVIDCYINSTSANITYTSGRVWKNMSQIYIRQKTAQFTATEVDNIFIDLDASPLITGAGIIDLRGNNAPPTAASLSARNSLVSKGKTVLHN